MTIPVTRRRENTRARLLEAATQVFAEVGLEGASVEAICERAGFTRGAFYSNFASKDELFLEMASSIVDQRLEVVRARIDEFVAAEVRHDGAEVLELVQQVMDSGMDDRLGVLMMSEIRIRALRDDQFGAAYLAQDRAMVASIEEIIQVVLDSGMFALRVDVPSAARMLMVQWEGCMGRGAIAGSDGDDLRRLGADALGELVSLIIAPAAR